MILVSRLTVRASSSAEAPITKTFPVPVTQVVRVRVKLPPVASGEIGFRLLKDGARFAPAPASDALYLTNVSAFPETIEWEEEQFAHGRQAAMTIEAYNTTAGDLAIEVRLSTIASRTDPKLLAVLDRLADMLPGAIASGKPGDDRQAAESRRLRPGG